MKPTKDQCKKFIVDHLCEINGVSPSQGLITPKTDLGKDLHIAGTALVELGKWLNQALWHDAYVLPGEIAACKTVGDLIDLIYKKAK